MSIYEERLQSDLNAIRARFEDQADRVAAAIANAQKALLTNDERLAYSTVIGDARINRNMREIDALCHRFIALHLPSAGHLRRISSGLRLNIQLERLGDYAVIVCRQAVRLREVPPASVARDLEAIGDEAQRMLKQATTAVMNDNVDMARVTIQMHGHMEHTLDAIYENLIASGLPATDLVPMFVIFNMLKRVADQAKNISEEALFVVTGEAKPLKTERILFVDKENTLLSKMVELVARKVSPDNAEFASAGSAPGEALNPEMVEFLQGCGIEIGQTGAAAIADIALDLDTFDVIVSVEGPVRSHVADIPFHTSALEWQLGTLPTAGTEEDYQQMYRAITLHVSELMKALRGE